MDTKEIKEESNEKNENKEKEELLNKLKDKKERAVKFYEDEKKARYAENLEYWRGEQGGAISRLFGHCDKVIANICLARVETLIPNIISRNIQVSISGEDDFAKVLNKLVFDELRNDRGYQEIYYDARDYGIYGECFTKTNGIVDLEEGIEEVEIKRVPVCDIFTDPDADNFNNLKFIIQKHNLDEEDFENNYPDADKSGISFSENKKTTVYEIYTKKSRNKWICYEVDENFKMILKQKEVKNHPYDYAGNIKDPAKIRPLGEIEPMIPLQNELNKILTQMSISRVSGGVKSLYEKGAIDATQLSKLQNGLDNEYNEVKDLAKVQDRPMRFQSGPFIDSEQLIMNLVQVITGASQLTLGGGAQGNVTARSDMLADARFEGRESQKREDIEDLVRGIVYKLVDYFRNDLEVPRNVELNGETIPVNKDYFKDMDYDPTITVRINTVGKVVRQAERDVLRQLFTDMTDSGIFQPEELRNVFKRILQTFDEFDGLDKMIEDLEIIDAEALQMQEEQSMQEQGMQEQAPGQMNIEDMLLPE